MSTPIEPFAFSPKAAAAYGGLGLTTVKALLRSGALPYRKAGKRTLILRTDLEDYLLALGVGRTNIPRNDAGKFVPRGTSVSS